jgi:DNA polymerase-3 subunit delta
VLRLFYGDDRVSMDAAVAQYAGSGGESAAVMNVIRLDGATVDLGELAGVCRVMPFFGGSRVVVVRGLKDRLQGAAKKDREELLAALADLPPTTELLVVEPDLSDDPQSHPLYDLAQGKGEVRAFRLAADGNVEEWLQRRCEALGIRLERNAAAELHRRVGDSAVALDSELEKLAAYALDSGVVDVEAVRELVTASAESSVFDLVEAMGRREAGRAAARLEDLLMRQSESALALLGMIARQFRLLLMAKDLAGAKMSQPQMARELSVPPWMVNRIVAQARLFTMGELVDALERTLQADFALKGGANLPESVVLTDLVVGLAGGGA